MTRTGTLAVSDCRIYFCDFQKDKTRKEVRLQAHAECGDHAGVALMVFDLDGQGHFPYDRAREMVAAAAVQDLNENRAKVNQ